MQTVKFFFAAQIADAPPGNHARPLLAWFRAFAADHSEFFPGIRIQYLHRNRLTGDYEFQATVRDEDYDPTDCYLFAEPDVDRRRPIVLDGKNYFVIGNSDSVTD